MLATVSATPAPARPSVDVPALSERGCPYCCADLARGAKKCRTCGEWVVRVSVGGGAALLRLVGWLWIILSVVAAAGVWYVGSVVRLWVLVRAVDPALTPLILDVVRYGLAGAVLLHGLTFGVTLRVIADLAPRRPRWWT